MKNLIRDAHLDDSWCLHFEIFENSIPIPKPKTDE